MGDNTLILGPTDECAISGGSMDLAFSHSPGCKIGTAQPLWHQENLAPGRESWAASEEHISCLSKLLFLEGLVYIALPHEEPLKSG